MSQSPGGYNPDALRARLALAYLAREWAALLREWEDAEDIADAEAAWDEDGEPVRFEDLEAEFA